MEKRENMEPKYMTKTSFDLNDYRKYVRTMQGSQLKNNIVALAVFAWLVAAGIYNIYHGKTALGVFMLVVGVAAPLLVRFGANNQIERDFEKIKEAGGTHFSVRFYEDRLETQNDTLHCVHEYSKIYDVVENDSAFYIEIEKGHSVIILKKDCDDELIAFLRTLKQYKP